jgi:hypothetical protein
MKAIHTPIPIRMPPLLAQRAETGEN